MIYSRSISIRSWYKNGAKTKGWMRKFKDTLRLYSNSDSEFVFNGLYEELPKIGMKMGG